MYHDTTKTKQKPYKPGHFVVHFKVLQGNTSAQLLLALVICTLPFGEYHPWPDRLVPLKHLEKFILCWIDDGQAANQGVPSPLSGSSRLEATPWTAQLVTSVGTAQFCSSQ